MANATHTDLIDLTRATPPVTGPLRDTIQAALRHLSSHDDLHLFMRSNRIGGNGRDIAVAGQWLEHRLGYAPAVDRVVAGNGTQNLLSLVLQNTSGRNGVLIAETLTHPLVPPIAKELGITVVGVDIDRDGIVPDAFEAACRRHPGAPLYCNPTGHNPTASVMPAARREAIGRLARAYGRDIIEDDVLGSLRRSGPRPVASFAPDRVWYLHTLSKCIGLGMRVAYLVAPEGITRDTIIAPVAMRSSWFAGALPLEIANHMFETKAFFEATASMADAAERRRQLIGADLDGYDLTTCQGALHAWLRLPAGWTSQAFADACRTAGVLVRASRMFFAETDRNPQPEVSAVRIALTAPLTDEDFRDGVSLVKSVLQSGQCEERIAV